MGIIRLGIPVETALWVAKQFGVGNFFETGTYRGDTTEWAAGHFKRVVTTERMETLHHAAAERLKAYDHVTCFHGDTREALREWLPQLEGPVLFWLDAHWCGPNKGSHGEEEQCPLLNELELIAKLKPDSFIFIDDARLFMMPPAAPCRIADWPNLARITERLSQACPGGGVFIDEDAILCVPSFATLALAELLQTKVTSAHERGEARARESNWSKGLRIMQQGLRMMIR